MSPPFVDLRSDTVTKPTAAMRRAMAEAEVGDDVFGEDPTVRELEEEAADVLGKEAAIFVPSGSMGNQVAIALACRPGDEVVCEARSHVFNYELDAMSALSGACPRPVAAPRGRLTPELVASALFPDVYYCPRARLLVLENTHNMWGGVVQPPEEARACADLARSRGLDVHLDGARIFNAAVALGRTPAELAACADTVMTCLSKGLGAPIGSLLAGTRERVTEARRVRKRFGGGMRQVGVLAAAGLVALRTGPALLADDHRRARRLAGELSVLAGAQVDPADVETNIVIVRTRAAAAEVVARLRERGVGAVAVGPHEVRFVTHRDVDDAGLERALEAARSALASA